jgi:hypothetical protein
MNRSGPGQRGAGIGGVYDLKVASSPRDSSQFGTKQGRNDQQNQNRVHSVLISAHKSFRRLGLGSFCRRARQGASYASGSRPQPLGTPTSENAKCWPRITSAPSMTPPGLPGRRATYPVRRVSGGSAGHQVRWPWAGRLGCDACWLAARAPQKAARRPARVASESGHAAANMAQAQQQVQSVVASLR